MVIFHKFIIWSTLGLKSLVHPTKRVSLGVTHDILNHEISASDIMQNIWEIVLASDIMLMGNGFGRYMDLFSLLSIPTIWYKKQVDTKF